MFEIVVYAGCGCLCLVADALSMQHALIHPLAGVLSAYGMGLAEITAMREAAVKRILAQNELLSITMNCDLRVMSRLHVDNNTSLDATLKQIVCTLNGVAKGKQRGNVGPQFFCSFIGKAGPGAIAV